MSKRLRLEWDEIRTRSVAFSKEWGNGPKDPSLGEKQEGQNFIRDLMHVFGIDSRLGVFEKPIRSEDGRDLYVDYLLPGEVIIEMKSPRITSLIRARNQCFEYLRRLEPRDRPRLMIVSNFLQMWVINVVTGHEFNIFRTSRLVNHVRKLRILAGYDIQHEYKTDIHVNIKASQKLAKIHDHLHDLGYPKHELGIYLVRILFCLFAEDTGIFEKRSFENYIRKSQPDGSDLSGRLLRLFEALNTPRENRPAGMPAELRDMRYINGRLFEEQLSFVDFDESTRRDLLECCDFDWGKISPAIFGAIFQGVMDPTARREMGAHYTSEENIMKLIQPLFMDNLIAELDRASTTRAELINFQNKLAQLTFLDPACGSGNFLIVAYQQLRMLEFELLKLIFLEDGRQQQMVDVASKIRVDQFYGIEYDEFPHLIAQMSMILVKHQMDQEVSHYFGLNTIDFPIEAMPNIVRGNALRIDWQSLSPHGQFSYIFGNPPFVGARYQNDEQKQDIRIVYNREKNLGFIDYVTAWFVKASQYMTGNQTQTAFVSTNSIVQGQQVSTLWPVIYDNGVDISFAHKAFKWANEAKSAAAVYCVIIGMQSTSHIKHTQRAVYDLDGSVELGNSISPYLHIGAPVIVKPRSKPLAKVSEMRFGNMAADGGNLLLEKDEMQSIINRYPEANEYIKRFQGAQEFIHGNERWCLWITEDQVRDALKIPPIREKVNATREVRLASKSTSNLAERPYSFREQHNPETAIVIPSATSENRKYIPMGYVDRSVILSNLVHMIPNGRLYEFGILNSATHMAWMRLTAGRLKSDYRYSKDLVYNTFPWPNSIPEQKVEIEKTAQGILDTRALFSDWTLAELYDELTMPQELRRAHQKNNIAVRQAYGEIGERWNSEDDCIADLLMMYQELMADENLKMKGYSKKRRVKKQ